MVYPDSVWGFSKKASSTEGVGSFYRNPVYICTNACKCQEKYYELIELLRYKHLHAIQKPGQFSPSFFVKVFLNNPYKIN